MSKRNAIHIDNPTPGCNCYTTPNQADHMVRRGEAVLIGRILHLLTPSEIRTQRTIEHRIASERRGSDIYIGDRLINWAGSRNPHVQYVPGIARS
jgi:hypothetical protein